MLSNPVSLQDDNGLNGALIGRLLNGILKFRGNCIDDDFCNFTAHGEHIRTGIHA